MSEVRITDVILHKNKYATQTFIVLNRMPVIEYERKNNFLIGEDSGFFSFYGYEKPSGRFKAFGGDEFNIPLKNGEQVKANGQWWDAIPRDYYDLGDLLISAGIGTAQTLSNCYVFTSFHMDKTKLDNWLSGNKPSNNYHKYDEKRKDLFMVNEITSRFK